MGPFKEKPIPDLYCVPINIIEKETSSGLYRLIQDFSYPWDDPSNGINAMVPKKNKKVTYSGIDDVARMALQLGSESFSMRIDIRHAFKLLPLKPSLWKFTAFKFLNAYFIQMQTPFGAAASCLHFEKTAKLLVWIIQHEMPWSLLTNYLDDFWLTQKTKSQLKMLAFHFIRIVEKEIGFPISHNKTLGPDNILDFVGLIVDLVNLCIHLPEEKRKKSLRILNQIIVAYENNRFVSVKLLERCTGTLNYACQAIPIGRPWLKSTYFLQRTRGNNKTDRTVTKKVAEDLKMFRTFLTSKDHFVTSVPFLDR